MTKENKFPKFINNVLQLKVNQVLNTYDKCVKRGKFDSVNEKFSHQKIKC